MNNHLRPAFPALIRRYVLQAIISTVLAAYLLSTAFELVHIYQNKRQNIQQLATLLTNSASTANGASIVAKQVSSLLDDDLNIQSIVFYSTTHSIADIEQESINQTTQDWKNALFASTVSFNYAVTSRDLMAESNKGRRVTDILDDSNLVGYINITLDLHELRLEWLRSHAVLWLSILGLGLVFAWFALRKLNGSARDVMALASICASVTDNPELRELPVMQQRFELQELIHIKQAFITLFERLIKSQQDYEALGVLEQQLHSKELSLNVQRHNFQSMITHELKTSLNAIVGGLQLLDNQNLNTEQKDTVAIIRKGSQQLVLTLEQIIQLNQIEKGQISINLSEFNPLQLIADILEEYEPIAKQKGLELISQVLHIDHILEGDAEKIQQILSILLDNAIKFTLSGHVTIKSQLTHFNKSNRWQISVKDSGIGIDTSYIGDVFNPFFQVDSSQTREYEGAGIGLPVMKRIAQLIGAVIEVESTLGVGSQFTVIIPLRNQYQARQNHVLSGLVIVYCYYREIGSLADELRRLGAIVTCQQQEQSVIEQMSATKVDMVMFAEDVLPNKAATLAIRIRTNETSHRPLLIYWYPQSQGHYVDSFEPGLKAAGIDYCHSVIRDDKVLSEQLKSWLSWT